MNNDIKTSDKIKIFADLLIEVKQNYEYISSMIKQLDREYDYDLAHEFELSSAKDKNKIATKARTNRLDRRYYKDRLEEYEPIYNLITEVQYKKAFDQLAQVLGKVRSTEKYHANRTYKPRVREENKIEKRIVV